MRTILIKLLEIEAYFDSEPQWRLSLLVDSNRKLPTIRS